MNGHKRRGALFALTRKPFAVVSYNHVPHQGRLLTELGSTKLALVEHLGTLFFVIY